jgi:two-component system sensor kinase FixL
MRISVLLRWAAITAVAVVLGVGWTVQRSLQKAHDSTRWVAHTSAVWTQLESVLGLLVDAERVVLDRTNRDQRRPPEALERAERDAGSTIATLAALTADNPNQQQRIPSLRDAVTRSLTALRQLSEASRRSETWPADLVNDEQVNMGAVRNTILEMRTDENALLDRRVQADQAAIGRLTWIVIGIALAAVALLVTALALLAREVNRGQRGADALLRANTDLEAAVSARSADLRDSNARLQSIIDSAVDGIIVIDSKGRIGAFNRGAERLFGYPAGEVIGRNVNMLMPSPQHEEHDDYLARYLQTGQATIIGTGREVTGRRRDGTTFPLHLSVGEMSVGGERMFTGMLHDLSERVRLEEQLRTSEARWRAIVQSAVDGIVVIDAHGRIEAFNSAAERLFGYAESDVVGRNVNTLMPPPYHEEHDIYLARYLATSAKKIIGTGREVTGLRRDGTTFPLHLAVGELVVNGERKFTGILHDLSVRVRMEEQLREQASLVRLGEMAAVLAHEVKNPLAGIRGAVQVIRTRLAQGSRDLVIADEIVARIDGLNELMKDLLLFARPPQPRLSSVELRTLVSSTAALIASDPALKNLDIQIAGNVPPVQADPELLKIVFANLLVNGAHAMDGRGTIHVSLGIVSNKCQVVFSDNGPGISPDVRDKLFTPFFTTKSRGSGLGLPTAKRLVEAHRGSISIACPPTGGTSVTVQFPTDGAVAAV